MRNERSECGNLQRHLTRLGGDLDTYLRFAGEDAMVAPDRWRSALLQDVPEQGAGIDGVMDEISRYLLPNASQIPHPGCSSFISTGATAAGALATLAAAVAAPQRSGLHAFMLPGRSLAALAGGAFRITCEHAGHLQQRRDSLNRAIHRQLIRNSRNMPSTTQINGKLAIRPWFIGARAGPERVDELLDEVRTIGARLKSQIHA